MTQIQSSASYLNYDPADPSKLPVAIPVVASPTPLSSLLASANRLTSETLKKSTFKKPTAEWQEDAWEMYDLVGEQRFLANTLAGRMSQARFYVGTIGEDNYPDEPQESKDPIANSVLESVGGGFAGLEQMVKRLAVNLFIAGDGWFIGVPGSLLDPEKEAQSVADPNIYMSDLEWFMLSVSEVEFQHGDTVKMAIGPNGESIEAKADDVFLIRIWNPHPRRMWEADSPTRSSLPVLRELVGLTMHISSQIDSRLAGAGLLFIPQSMQRALKTAAGMDENEEHDIFTESLMEAMMEPINDRSSAAAVVPLTITAPDDSIEKVKHLTFDVPLDAEARELRDEAIRRLALGQDAPPELLLGTAGMNHWGAWLVREDVVSTHLEPTLALICDALTTQYLRPVLEEAGYPPEQLERLVIWYKVDHMISRPNRSADALNLHDKGVISDKSVREAHGFDDNDAPEHEEDASKQLRLRAVEMALELVRSAPTLAESVGLEELTSQIEALLSGEEDTGLDESVEEAVEEDVEIDPEVPEPEDDPETDDRPAGPDSPPDTAQDPAPVGQPPSS